MDELRQEASYVMTTEGVDEAASKLDDLASANERAADQAGVLSRQTVLQEQSITRVAAKLEAYTRAQDPLSRALAQVERGERLVEAARSRGVDVSARTLTALEAAREKHRSLAEAEQESAKKLDEASSGVGAFRSQLDRISSFLWQNTSLSGPAIDRVINPIKGLSGAIGVIPTIAGATAAAVGAMFAIIGDRAQEALAKLGEVQKQTGVGATALEGGKIVGSRVGLDLDSSIAAFQNASRQFEQFKRNAGEVKDVIEKIDEAFLKVADKAKSSGEFIEIVGRKIRELPREEGIDLAKALYGSDAGEKLYEPIVQGQLEMKKLGETASAAGVALNDGVVKQAEEAQRKIDEAAATANGKFLAALQSLAPPVAALKTEFYGVIGAIADATAKAVAFVTQLHNGVQELRDLTRARNDVGGGKPFSEVFAPYRRAIVGDEVQGPKQQRDAGISRARYVARDAEESGGGRKSAAKSPRAQTDEVERFTQSLQKQTAALEGEAAAIGKSDAERERSIDLSKAAEIAKEAAANGSRKSAELTDVERQKIEGLAQAHVDLKKRIDDAAKAKEAEHQAESFFATEAYDVVDGVITKHEKLKNVLADVAKAFEQAALKSLLLGEGPLAGVLGTGSNGPLAGGVFGSLFSSGGGSGGGGGGLLSGIANALPKFADGGGVGAVVHEGEVILNQAQQRNVAGGLQSGPPNITVHNYAGARVATQITPEGVAVMIRSAIAENNSAIPGMLSDHANRQW